MTTAAHGHFQLKSRNFVADVLIPTLKTWGEGEVNLLDLLASIGIIKYVNISWKFTSKCRQIVGNVNVIAIKLKLFLQ